VTGRVLAWALTLPLAAAGVLAGHALAYALTGEDGGSVHAYLAHGPQIAALLATTGLACLAVQQRSSRLTGARPYALLGVAGFAAQEHLERLLHSGDLPWLLTQPTFLRGLALQLPVALACLGVARRVLRAATGARASRPPSLSLVTLVLPRSPVECLEGLVLVEPLGRAPPVLLRP
jgi:hypothetical protein